MKTLPILAISLAVAVSLALAPSASAQAEIDPDHFDAPSMVPLHQPSPAIPPQANRYDVKFSLPYAVQCTGKNLAPGKYSASLRSDGEVGHGVLKSENQSVEVTSIVHPAVSRRGANVVIVGSRGRVRTLSAIHVSGVNFVFDPIFKADTASSREKKRLETLPLTVIAFKASPNRGSR